MKLVVANFKSHQTVAEARGWMENFTNGYRKKEEVGVVLAPSFTNIEVYRKGRGSLEIAAQDVSAFPAGAYTGAVNAKQLWSLGIKYTIVGHSERRRWFHETHQEIANKCRELIEAEIMPILCVDRGYIDAQLAALEDGWETKIVIAYEPAAAIGSGQAENPEKAGLMAKMIKTRMTGVKAVIYGGSVNLKNTKSYLDSWFDGCLVGAGSLDPKIFLEIINCID